MWIDTADIEALLQTALSTDPWIAGVVRHAEQLVEAEIGAVDEAAVPAGLAAVGAQIAARLWRAGRAAVGNPAGNAQETLGPHSFTAGNLAAGFGLTRAERDQLARFRNPLWVQPTHQSSSLQTPGGLIADTAGGDPILLIADDDLEVTEG